MIKNAIQIMCKHRRLDADFSPKTMECFLEIFQDDEDAILSDEASFEEEAEHYSRLSDKDVDFFSGNHVTFGDYICYMQDVKEDV